MIKIKTPATSANVGIGYDVLGIALNLFNEFTFRETNKTTLVGFSDKEPSRNLVYQSYVSFCEENNISNPTPVEISLVKQDIPISRGLGSSASCILAGVLAANHIHNVKKSLFECTVFASKLEGHPDNVFACSFGKLTATYHERETYYYDTFDISEKLFFYVLIPNIKGHTEELRGLVPNSFEIHDVIHNMSRIIHLPKAFKDGDYGMLKTLLIDKIHEPYRFHTLAEQEKIVKFKQKMVLVISGSGPTLLAISDKNDVKALDELRNSYDVKEVFISNGVELEVTK